MEELKLCSEFVQCLKLKQLMPRHQDELVVTVEESDEDLSQVLANDHLDFGVLLKTLINLKELCLTFG